MEQAAALPHRQQYNAGAAATPKKRHTQLKLVVTLLVTTAALLDWTRSPRDQWSVRLYDLAVIKPYRAAIHPLSSKVSRCRFRPTCSRYSQEAMHSHGFPEGLCFTMWRLMRCGPWVRPGTADPVPQ